jgi:hypothetical protein
LPWIDTSATPTRKGSGLRGSTGVATRSTPPQPAPAGEAADPPPRAAIQTSWTDLQFMGLPILFWILFLGGIATAAALAVAFLRTRV